MTTTSTILVCSSILFSLVGAHPTSINTVQDVNMQSNKLLRCWQPVNSKDDGAGYELSEPIYPLCNYMPHPTDYSKFFVNGVQESSDDYTNIYKIFKDAEETHAILNVCLQEAFQFSGPNRPAQVSLRCMCKRDACNIPKPLTTFLDFNKSPIPQF